jgi:hypothetical protein
MGSIKGDVSILFVDKSYPYEELKAEQIEASPFPFLVVHNRN